MSDFGSIGDESRLSAASQVSGVVRIERQRKPDGLSGTSGRRSAHGARRIPRCVNGDPPNYRPVAARRTPFVAAVLLRKREECLSDAVRNPNGQIASAVVAENVDRRHAADATAEMTLAASHLTEHQLYALVVRVERRAEERIRELLRLRA